MRIGSLLKGEEYPENLNDSLLLRDAEKREGEEDSIVVESKDARPEWAKYLTFVVDVIKRLAFCVANHPILDTPKDLRKYGVRAELYNESGELLHSVDSSSSASCAGIKINPACRELTKRHQRTKCSSSPSQRSQKQCTMFPYTCTQLDPRQLISSTPDTL